MHPLFHLAPLAVCAAAAVMVAPDTGRAALSALRQRRRLRAAGLAGTTTAILAAVVVSAVPLAAWVRGLI